MSKIWADVIRCGVHFLVNPGDGPCPPAPVTTGCRCGKGAIAEPPAAAAVVALLLLLLLPLLALEAEAGGGGMAARSSCCLALAGVLFEKAPPRAPPWHGAGVTGGANSASAASADAVGASMLSTLSCA
jgi:hypothetical protein